MIKGNAITMYPVRDIAREKARRTEPPIESRAVFEDAWIEYDLAGGTTVKLEPSPHPSAAWRLYSTPKAMP